jgi:hypothetical protein
MTDVPSIKGAGFQDTWEELNGHLQAGRTSREQVEVRLNPEALQIVDEKLEPSLWYPLAHVDAITEVNAAVTGDSGRDYYKGMGKQAFDRLMSRSSFKIFFEGAMANRERAGTTLIGLSGLVYSFGEWEWSGEELSNFTVEMTDATPMASFREFTAAGFIEALAAHTVGDRLQVTVARPTRDRIVFRGRLGLD